MFLLDWRPHVPEESSRPVGPHVHVVHSVHVVHVAHVHVHVAGGVEMVSRTGAGHLVELVRPAVHVGARDGQPHLAVDVGGRARVVPVVEAGEDDMAGRGVRVVAPVQPRRRRHEHRVVRPGHGLRVGQPRHMVPAEEKVPRRVRRHMVGMGVGHGGVAVGLGPVLLLRVPDPRVPHPVVGRGELQPSVTKVRCMRSVHERIQHVEGYKQHKILNKSRHTLNYQSMIPTILLDGSTLMPCVVKTRVTDNPMCDPGVMRDRLQRRHTR